MTQEIKIGDTVRKKSGKPFKSGSKTAIVSGLTVVHVPSAIQKGGIRPSITRQALEFSTESSGYFVTTEQCEKVP